MEQIYTYTLNSKKEKSEASVLDFEINRRSYQDQRTMVQAAWYRDIKSHILNKPKI